MLKYSMVLAGLAMFLDSTIAAQSAGDYTITDIEAHLYHQETATVDRANVTAESSPNLWNTIIGDGDASTPSGATLVIVKVKGSWIASAKPPKLKLTVQEVGGAELFRQVVNLIALFSEKSSISVPFIVFGTGCSATRLTATLVDTHGSAQGTLGKTIPFECGE